MKNIFLIIVTLSSLYFKAQTYPLNTSPSDIPANGYIKDMNNELNKYVGLWKGTWDGKTLFLELRKVKYYYGGNDPYYIDKIVGERKVVTANGTREIDRITRFDEKSPEFRGMTISLKNGNWKRLTFYPKNMCRKMASIDITNFTPTQMTLHFEYLPSIVEPNCQHNSYVDQNGDFPINFPKDIVLIKQ
ncbi:hypothetical protein PFY10_20065 [Chryseobacterium daecheongense]|nr:hypothetical protein PFY10_20065 [Chryseobacterium daecheongense]